MKSKQERRVPAKQPPPSQAGQSKAVKVVTPPTSSLKSGADEVADLFSAIRRKKVQLKGRGSSPAGSSSHDGNRKGKAVTTGANKGGGAPSFHDEAKPIRDGLYHAPQKSVQMSDNEFFSGTWLKANQTAATSSGGAAVVVGGGGGGSAGPTEASQELLRKEGVDRIVSMEELSKMLSRNAKAGTTPNCPFDCDCCF